MFNDDELTRAAANRELRSSGLSLSSELILAPFCPSRHAVTANDAAHASELADACSLLTRPRYDALRQPEWILTLQSAPE
jgi:hypothetical protein